jgi:DNA-binding transcriptional regulator YdaS (Cro superfamily)
MKELDIYDFPELKRPLIKVINKLGGISVLTNMLSLSPQTVHAWVYLLEKGIPAHRCVEIESVTNGEITCKQLRPDLFGKDAEFKPLTLEEDLNRTIRKLQKLLKGIVWVDTNRVTMGKKSKKGDK